MGSWFRAIGAAAAVIMTACPGAFAQTLPPAAGAASAWTFEPGPVDFKFAFTGSPTQEGVLGQIVEPARRGWFANPFFRPEAYTIDCATKYLLARQAATDGGSRVCRIVEAPVVGKDFAERLQREGYEIAVSYPFADAGNGRALLFWSAKVGAEGTLPVGQGFARLEADVWRNQFEPAARCVGPHDRCIWRYFPHGDAFGSFINRFEREDRVAAARIYQRVGVDAMGRPMTSASIVIDEWLATRPADLPAAVSSAASFKSRP